MKAAITVIQFPGADLSERKHNVVVGVVAGHEELPVYLAEKCYKAKKAGE